MKLFCILYSAFLTAASAAVVLPPPFPILRVVEVLNFETLNIYSPCVGYRTNNAAANSWIISGDFDRLITFEFSGLPGTNYLVEISTNATGWTTYDLVTGDVVPIRWTDWCDTNTRLYRLRLQ